MSQQILATKLNIPPLRKNRVPRPRLVKHLAVGLESKLTLICSPAGYGKTTLLSEFAAVSKRPAAWFSIDQDDNDSTRFISYLIAALSTVVAEFGKSVNPALQTPKPERIEALLAVLINEISTEFSPFILILDDYHLVTNPAVHAHMTYLIEHQPEQMHIMIATRADPPLPLTRLRARAQLSEIRERDLRFDLAEAAEFLNQVMHLDLNDEDLVVMEERTEGWAAGLQLAALSLREQPDKAEFVSTFAGSNRYILDYLGQEVLDNQEPGIRNFLLKTAILQRFTAPLCESLTGLEDSQGILESLERDHLFIQPLDQERTWYRYHNLFQDFLLKSLQQTQPDQIPVLHYKASEWFAAQGMSDEAIEHALAAGDHKRAVDLIQSIAEDRLMRSEVSSIIRWIDELPLEELAARPSLALTQAWALILRGGPLEKIESNLNLVDVEQVDDQLQGSTAALRAFLASIKGDVKASMELSVRALELISEDNLFMRSLVNDNLGMVYLILGDFDASIREFEKAAEISRQAGIVMIAVGALCNMAGLWMLQGQLKRAWSANMEALTLATDRRGRRLPVAGKALLGLGEIAREWNRLDAAERFLSEGIELFRLFGELGSVISYVTLARIKEVQGDLPGAQEIVDLARKLAIQFDASTMDDEMVAAYQAQLWIKTGDSQQAIRWMKDIQLENLVAQKTGEMRFDPIWEIHSQTLARVYASQGRYEDALLVIEPLLEIAQANQRLRSVLKMLALQAVILKLMGENQEALTVIGQALDLARDENFVCTFLDEGEPMVALLNEAAARGIVTDYAGHLLAEYASPEPSRASSTDELKAQSGIVEPLSGREIEVLALIAEGFSNQEIAARLHISLSTVKGHNSNIYGKLSVKKRTQAVARAKELGILAGT